MDESQRDERVAKLLGSEHIRYQNINLGGGESTGGHVRTSMDDILFASDLKRVRLLDIGSALGHFCLEALKHGASAATGLETSPERARHAREIADIVDPRAQYIPADFEYWDSPDKSFDVVLCLNVLHHLYDPVAALRKIMRITAKRFYLEVAPVSVRDVVKMGNPLALFGASGLPVILLGPTANSTRAADRTFTFSKKAIATIVNGHSKAFEPVLFHHSSFKGRWIVEARRRDIGHLVVVCGPTAVGKSSFAKALEDPALRERFGIDGDYSFVQAKDLDRLATGRHDTLVYHYDMLRPFDRPLQSHGRDPAFHLLQSAERITFITLAADGKALQQRIGSESARASGRKGRKRHALLQKQYGNPTFLKAWYEAWATATAPFRGKTFLVRADEGYPAIKPETLPKLLDS
jgi:SAM-dependent methyltransferase